MKVNMPKPKPVILLENINTKTHKAEQVLAATSVYAVFYRGNPINLRVGSTVVTYPGPKYRKTAFTAPAHAFNMAERLNKIFNTQEFVVMQMTNPVQISESDTDEDDDIFSDMED